MYSEASRKHSSANPLDASLREADSPKEVRRSRHFSGKNPDTGVRKVIFVKPPLQLEIKAFVFFMFYGVL